MCVRVSRDALMGVKTFNGYMNVSKSLVSEFRLGNECKLTHPDRPT